MTIYRIKNRTTPFVQIEKAALEDRRLSWKAKGILSYLLSKPDDFIFYLDKLTEHSTDGIDSLRAGIKELQQFGYVKRYPIKEKGKIVSWGLDVYEKPDRDFPHMEKPQMENPTLIINKDLSNKDLSNNKRYIALESDDPFIEIYLNHLSQKKKKHPRVTEEQREWIINQIEHLREYEVTAADWEEQVKDHFEHLPKNNNGNIIAFLHASHRRFDVGMFDQF